MGMEYRRRRGKTRTAVKLEKARQAGEHPAPEWTRDMMVRAVARLRRRDAGFRPGVDIAKLDTGELRAFALAHTRYIRLPRVGEVEYYRVDAGKLARLTWRDVNQRRADKDDLPYVLADTARGRTLTGGVLDGTFTSDDGDTYPVADVTVRGCALTDLQRRKLETDARRMRQQAAETRAAMARRVERARTWRAGRLYCPPDVFAAAVERYRDRYGYLPDSVAALARVHPELATTREHDGVTCVVAAGRGYCPADQTGGRRLDLLKEYPHGVRTRLKDGTVAGRWIDPAVLAEPDVRVWPVMSSTDASCLAALAGMWARSGR